MTQTHMPRLLSLRATTAFCGSLLLLASIGAKPVVAQEDLIRGIVGTGAAILLNEALRNRPQQQPQSQPSRQTQPTQAPAQTQQSQITRQERFQVQAALNLLNYEAGPVDGVFGRRTRAAVSRFQADHGFPVTGRLDRAQMQTLFARASGAPAGTAAHPQLFAQPGGVAPQFPTAVQPGAGAARTAPPLFPSVAAPGAQPAQAPGAQFPSLAQPGTQQGVGHGLQFPTVGQPGTQPANAAPNGGAQFPTVTAAPTQPAGTALQFPGVQTGAVQQDGVAQQFPSVAATAPQSAGSDQFPNLVTPSDDQTGTGVRFPQIASVPESQANQFPVVEQAAPEEVDFSAAVDPSALGDNSSLEAVGDDGGTVSVAALPSGLASAGYQTVFDLALDGTLGDHIASLSADERIERLQLTVEGFELDDLQQRRDYHLNRDVPREQVKTSLVEAIEEIRSYPYVTEINLFASSSDGSTQISMEAVPSGSVISFTLTQGLELDDESQLLSVHGALIDRFGTPSYLMSNSIDRLCQGTEPFSAMTPNDCVAMLFDGLLPESGERMVDLAKSSTAFRPIWSCASDDQFAELARSYAMSVTARSGDMIERFQLMHNPSCHLTAEAFSHQMRVQFSHNALRDAHQQAVEASMAEAEEAAPTASVIRF